MAKPLLRTDREIRDIYERHKRTVYRVCYAYMKNVTDTEDALQDTFYRLISAGPEFADEEHEKAWLIRTAANVCKNMLRHWWRKHKNLDDYEDYREADNREVDNVLSVVMDLPAKYKSVIYLYYYEGYNSSEIAVILEKPCSTIRNYLSEARRLLRERLGEEFL